MTQKIRGKEASELITATIADHSSGIKNHLSQFDPRIAVCATLETLRGVEEFINMPIFGLDDEALENSILNLRMDPIDSIALHQVCIGLKRTFGEEFTRRFVQTLLQASAIGTAFRMHGAVEPATGLQSVKHAIGYFQSRRRHLVTILYTLAIASRGTKHLSTLDVMNEFLPQIEHSGLTISGLHQNLMLAKVYSDFELTVGKAGFFANHSYETLDNLFLEPERASILDVQNAAKDPSLRKTLEKIEPHLLFSAAEVRNNIILLEEAYSEFDLSENPSFSSMAELVRYCLTQCSDNYNIAISLHQFDALMAKANLSQHARSQLLHQSGDYSQNLNSYAPFIRVNQQIFSTVTLISRFLYYWKNICLNRIRRYQIRSGFIFEANVKKALSEQGFHVTDIKRINRKEFDVVTVLDNVIYNVQCKNNLIDLSKIESNPRLFARYNRRLDRSYASALLKEENREQLLQQKIGLSEVKHFVLSRFPVATINPRVLAFNRIDKFRQIAVNR